MKFKVGDVCITLPVEFGEQMVPTGTEVTILEWRVRPDGRNGYRITPDVCCVEECLRLKDPPAELKREELGSWDLCPWQPKEITVHD